jgi:hypothetical protein
VTRYVRLARGCIMDGVSGTPTGTDHLLVDLDALFAAVGQRDNQRLRVTFPPPVNSAR